MKKCFFLFLITFLMHCNASEKSEAETKEPQSNSTEADMFTEAVIEIPTGTVDKFELNKKTGEFEQELINGKPRQVDYLGYPGNYGFIPNTFLSKENGGDGDPLDVLVLGEAVKRESKIKVKVIGVLKLLDKGEQDDKLIAVQEGTSFYKYNSLAELNKNYVGISTIVETWFTSYKGSGKMISKGFGGKKEALSVLSAARKEFKEDQ